MQQFQPFSREFIEQETYPGSIPLQTGIFTRSWNGSLAPRRGGHSCQPFIEFYYGFSGDLGFPSRAKGIEAFPNAFLGVCLDDGVYTGMPKLKRWQKFRWLYEQWKRLRLVESLPGLTLKQRRIFGEKFQQRNHHEHQAAIICILTGLLVARNQFIAVGDAQGGWFFLPPWSCWKEWARDAVCANLRQLNADGVQMQKLQNGRTVSFG
jgi:hypothetical protein